MLSVTFVNMTLRRGDVVKRLDRIIQSATRREYVAGKYWYRNAMLDLTDRAPHFTAKQRAGVAAALSPMVRWERNIEEMGKVYDNYLELESMDAIQYSGFAAYNANVRKAYMIAQGAEPEAILRGNKVVAFYHALMGTSTRPVLDSLAINAAVGLPAAKSTSEAAKVWFDRPRALRLIEEAYIIVAARRELTPIEAQGIVWTVYRGERDKN